MRTVVKFHVRAIVFHKKTAYSPQSCESSTVAVEGVDFCRRFTPHKSSVTTRIHAWRRQCSTDL